MNYKIGPKLGKPRMPKFTTLKTAHKGLTARRSSAKTALRVLGTIIAILFGLGLVGGSIGLVVAAGYVSSINASLPDATKLATLDFDQSTKIFDRNGTLLYTLYGEQNREYVKLDQIPDKVKWALLATEDSNFYEHKGVDIARTIKGAFDVVTGGSTSGRSTITQQYARQTVLFKVLGDDAFKRDPTRKVKEILIAFQLENKLSKDQILELYMNQVPLGGTTYGYKQAARDYFDKDLKDLTLGEAAFMAGIIQAPSQYRNALIAGNVKAVQARRDDVLDLMLKFKDKTNVTEEDVKKAKEETLVYKPGKTSITAPHFVFYVIDQLEKQYGAEALRTSGLRITTTLDLNVQKVIEAELLKSISNFKTWYGVNNGAVVVINPRNGEILGMQGSVDYNNNSDPRVDGNVNVAVMPRQMGSSTKPYTYIEAFRNGSNPGTLAPDIPFNFGAYKPTDWNNKYEGVQSIRTALNHSRNIPAVYTLQANGGPDTFLNAMDKLGFTTFTDRSRYGLSVTLGAGDMKLLEHTNAFAAFANKGVQYSTSAILKIEDSKGNTIFTNDPKKSEKRVYTEEETFLLNWILCQMGGRDDKSAASFYYAGGQKWCGKTGTTNGPKDLITMAYYPRASVGIWTGNNNGQLTYGTKGQGWSENVPIVIAKNIMEKLIPMFGKDFYVQPAGVAAGSVCTDTGMLANDSIKCNKESTVYIKSKTPPLDNAHNNVFPICKINGKIPSNEAEARANNLVDDKLFLDFTIPVKQQQGIFEDWMRTKNGVLFLKDKPDTAPCVPEVAFPTISITSPSNLSTVTQGTLVPITTNPTIASPGTIAQVTFYLDGVAQNTIATSPYTYNWPVSNTLALGNHTIKAVVLDSYNRTAEASITVIVIAPVPTPTPTASPTPKPTVTTSPTPTGSPTPPPT